MLFPFRYLDAAMVTLAMLWRQVVWSIALALPPLFIVWKFSFVSNVSAGVLWQTAYWAAPLLLGAGSLPAVWGALRARYSGFQIVVRKRASADRHPLEEHQDIWQQELMILGSAVAVASILIFAAVMALKIHQVRSIRTMEPSDAHFTLQRDTPYRALRVITADSRTLNMESALFPKIKIQAYAGNTRELVLVADGMPFPGRGRQFSLWIRPDNGPPVAIANVEIGLGGEVLEIIAIPIPREQIRELFITDEPWGGRPRPSADAIWAVRIPKGGGVPVRRASTRRSD